MNSNNNALWASHVWAPLAVAAMGMLAWQSYGQACPCAQPSKYFPACNSPLEALRCAENEDARTTQNSRLTEIPGERYAVRTTGGFRLSELPPNDYDESDVRAILRDDFDAALAQCLRVRDVTATRVTLTLRFTEQDVWGQRVLAPSFVDVVDEHGERDEDLEWCARITLNSRTTLLAGVTQRPMQVQHDIVLSDAESAGGAQ